MEPLNPLNQVSVKSLKVIKTCVSLLQTAHRSAGGSEVQMEDKFRLIGVELHREAANVCVACSKTAWTPNTSATAMLTVTNGAGYCPALHFLHSSLFLILIFSFVALSSRASDSGLLTHKETLPVRSLVLGDVHRPGSESMYRLGPLQCHGDSKSIIIFSQ